ncbi:MAG: hypothetical protein AAFV53_26095 [Myxococcota bacterium]
MAAKQIADNYHLSLSIGKALWDELLGAALPATVSKGSFELTRAVYQGVKQLQVKERVVALLEDEQTPPFVAQARSRASAFWRRRRSQVYGFIQEMVRVEGDWQIQIDRDGTEFQYAPQRIGVDAHARAIIHGRAYLLRENLELPFTIEKRLGAACSLGNIRYDKDERAVVGEVMQPSVDLGEHVILQMLNAGLGRLLEQQIHRFDKVPILKKDQVEDLVGPAGGPLKLKMGVEDIALEISDDQMTLKVRFGFSQLQLPGE